jgi:antitoxin PrlF
MPAIVEISTITAKGQTTVPKAVRQALGVQSGDKIIFRVDESGAVTVLPVAESVEDPALGPFLALLARDIERRPAALRPLTPGLAARMAKLTAGAEADPDQVIDGDVAL